MEVTALREMQARTSQRWSLYLLWWTNRTFIFDIDTRVKFNQFVRRLKFKINKSTGGECPQPPRGGCHPKCTWVQSPISEILCLWKWYSSSHVVILDVYKNLHLQSHKMSFHVSLNDVVTRQSEQFSIDFRSWKLISHKPNWYIVWLQLHTLNMTYCTDKEDCTRCLLWRV